VSGAPKLDPGPLEHTFDLDSPALHAEVTSFEAHVRREMKRAGATTFVTAVREDGRKRHVVVVMAYAPGGVAAAPPDAIAEAIRAPERPLAPAGLTPPATKGAGLRRR
jgi:hypothetical protein